MNRLMLRMSSFSSWPDGLISPGAGEPDCKDRAIFVITSTEVCLNKKGPDRIHIRTVIHKYGIPASRVSCQWPRCQRWHIQRGAITSVNKCTGVARHGDRDGKKARG